MVNRPVALRCGIFLSLLTIGPALARQPFSFGFVQANVTCKKEAGFKRLILVSSVFSYCEVDHREKAILVDAARLVNASAVVNCGSVYDITFQHVNTSSSRQAAAMERTKQLNNPNYDFHAEVPYTFTAYSTSCQ